MTSIEKIDNSWIKKYAPKTKDDLLFTNNQIEEYLKNGLSNNLILYGSPGLGKSSFVRVFLNELKIPSEDYMFINASDENGIDTIRNKIQPFVKSSSFMGSYRIVVFDEADNMSQDAMKILRGLFDEAIDVYFIFTANDIHKILEPIRSRCIEIEITKPKPEDLLKVAKRILNKENIEFKDEDLDEIIKESNDIRNLIITLQELSKNGKLNLEYLNKNKNILEDLFKYAINKDGFSLKELVNSIDENFIEYFWKNAFSYIINNYNVLNNRVNVEKILITLNEGQLNHKMAVSKKLNLIAVLLKML